MKQLGIILAIGFVGIAAPLTAFGQNIQAFVNGAGQKTLVGSNTPLPTAAAPYIYTPLGCGQLATFSTATFLSAVSGGIPAGATMALLSVETNNVRYRDDGIAPTSSVGTPLAAGLSAWPYSGSLSAIKFIPTTGSATVDVCFYK